MPTATIHHITPATKPPAPSRRALFGAGAALLAGGAIAATAARGATTTTPIGALHRQYRSIDARHAAMDEALIEMPDGPEHDALRVSFHQLQDDRLTLQARMVALQAETLEDAAIQVTLCYYLADSMDPHPTAEEVSELSQQFRTALASVLLVIGGADLDRFAGSDMARLCDRHGPAGRAKA